jgi:peptidoglycan/LPS O-acetylase OafA/YrhL
MFVVWGHFLFQYGVEDSIPIIAYTPLRLFYNAIPAVSFFFVLSGLVLTKKYFEKKAPLNIKSYYVARLFRIYPAFIVVLILSFLLKNYLYRDIGTVPPIASDRLFWEGNISFVSFLKEANLFFNLNGSNLIPPRWSLVVEIQVSLLIPFFILIAEKKTAWFLGLIAVMMICFWASDCGIFFLMHFAIGMCMAKYFKNISRRRKGINMIILLLIGICVYQYRYMVPYVLSRFSSSATLSQIVGHPKLIFVSEGIGAAIILYCIIASSRIQKILRIKSLVFVGKISYSVYLSHFVILFMLTPHFIRFLNNQGINSLPTTMLMGLVFTSICVLLLSTILYYSVEKPFIAIGKSFYNSFERKTKRIKNWNLSLQD